LTLLVYAGALDALLVALELAGFFKRP